MSYVNLNYHIILGTKYQEPTIEESIEERLYAYIGGILRNRDGVLLAAGGTADHVHLLASLHQTTDVASVVRDIKSNANQWINDLEDYPHDFQWKVTYGAFTVSRSGIPDVSRYIENQKEHHRRKSFRREFTQYLEKHDVDYDEQYLWE